MKPDRNEIHGMVMAVLEELTEDWDLEPGELGPDTRLGADLALSSVDVLNFLASLDVRFSRRLDYEKLILRGDSFVDDLAVRELVDFVDGNWESVDPEPRAM